jgi:serine O-acetyltransferase
VDHLAVARTRTVVDKAVVKMVQLWTAHRGRSVRAKLARYALKLLGVDWQPLCVGPGLTMPHATTGSVVHVKTRLGSRVTVFHGVTIGRASPWGTASDGDLSEGVVVGDDVVLGTNAAVLFRNGEILSIGEGTVVGANSVLLTSTGPGEVWAGNPARRVR